MEGYWKNHPLMYIGRSGIIYGFCISLPNYKNYNNSAKMGNLSFDIVSVKKLSPE
jgi:hypothetical protein